MAESLRNRIALVTGAGRGIGQAVAVALARAGVEVILTARTRGELETTREMILALGGRCWLQAGDLTDDAFVEGLFLEVGERHRQLHILVNAAGIGRFAPVAEMTPVTFREVLGVNVVAAFACIRAALPWMRAAGGGRIVNIGSVRAHWGERGDAGAYNASKAALHAMTEAMTRQFQHTHEPIALGLVCPGWTDTRLINPRGLDRPEFMQPETVAEAVLHTLTAPTGVTIFDMTLFPLAQKPW